MPHLAAERRRVAADGRHFTIHHDQVSFTGTSQVYGELDLADALDLEQAVTQGAAQLKDLGSEDPLDVRRAVAVGELARHQLALNLTHPDAGPDDAASVSRPVKARQVVLYVHLSDTAITGNRNTGGLEVGRVENTRSMVTADQIRDWCHNPDTQVTVKPVIDLNQSISVGQYEVPDRIVEHVVLRDQHCVFPWCTRPARSCDVDHVIPHARGGPTSTSNTAALCRRHHRLKTHGGWTYTMLEPGSFLWSSPHGYQYHRDHTGTIDVTPDGSRRPRSASHPPDQ